MFIEFSCFIDNVSETIYFKLAAGRKPPQYCDDSFTISTIERRRRTCPEDDVSHC